MFNDSFYLNVYTPLNVSLYSTKRLVLAVHMCMTADAWLKLYMPVQM